MLKRYLSYLVLLVCLKGFGQNLMKIGSTNLQLVKSNETYQLKQKSPSEIKIVMPFEFADFKEDFEIGEITKAPYRYPSIKDTTLKIDLPSIKIRRGDLKTGSFLEIKIEGQKAEIESLTICTVYTDSIMWNKFFYGNDFPNPMEALEKYLDVAKQGDKIIISNILLATGIYKKKLNYKLKAVLSFEIID